MVDMVMNYYNDIDCPKRSPEIMSDDEMKKSETKKDIQGQVRVSRIECYIKIRVSVPFASQCLVL